MKRIIFIIFLIISPLVFSHTAYAVDCSPTQDGMTYTIADDCTFPSPIDGVDAGTGIANIAKLVVTSDKTLTLGNTQSIAVGDVTVQSGAVIIVPDGSQINIGVPIWVEDNTDNDGDSVVGTAGGGNAEIAYTQPTGKIRKNQFSAIDPATIDCNDSDPYAWTLGDRWVATGYGAARDSLAYSDDGITWTGVSGWNIFSSEMGGRGVAFNGTRWVATGDRGTHGHNTLAYSNNGFIWTGLGMDIFSTVGYGIAWNGNRFVATGYGTNTLAYSTDGIIWTGIGNTVTFSPATIATNGKWWVTCGGSSIPSVAYSRDGITWTAEEGTEAKSLYFCTDALWNGTRWFITDQADNFVYSDDGIIWTGLFQRNEFDQAIGIAWNGTRFVSVGMGLTKNSIAYSSDGFIWTGLDGRNIFSGAGYFVASAPAPDLIPARPQACIASGPVSTPTTTPTPTPSPAVPACSTNRWVIVGNDAVAYSSDGITWTQVAGTAGGTRIAWNGFRWVKVESGYEPIHYSADGITWTRMNHTLFSSGANDVTWDGTKWVAVGSGLEYGNTIGYSYDNITWTGLGMSTFTNNGNGIAWNGTKFIALGKGDNSLAYSADGITWTGLGATIFTDLGFAAAWNGTRWVAVGRGTNTLAYSTDGIIWTGLGTAIFSDGAYGVAWNGTRFVVGGRGTNSLAYSTDGITWTGLGTGIFSTNGYSIAWNGTRFVATGAGTNTIAYSDDGITWTGLGTSILSSTAGVASAPAPQLIPARPAMCE